MRSLPIFAAALLALYPVAAAGRIDPAEGMAGVWRGTVGNQPVHACFDWGGENGLNGAYYYDRYLKPIRLQQDGADLAEAIGFDNPTGPHWQFDRLTAASLSATFRDGDRRVPIRLQRVDWQEDEYYPEACGSRAFIAPRFAGGTWVEEGGEVAGHRLFTTNFVLPPQLVPPPVGYPPVVLAGLRLVETQPGDPAINRELAADVSLDNVFECFAGTMSVTGVDGDMSVTIVPEVLTDRWLGVAIARGDYCGGAHPNHYQDREVFDRQSGQQVNPDDWFNARAMTVEWIDTGSGPADRYRQDTMSESLLSFVLARWAVIGEPEDSECRDIAASAYGWDIGLAPGGLAFMPELPHVAQACAETVTVTWADVAPFLNDRGRSVMAELAAP